MRKLIRNLLVTFILLALCTASNCKKPNPKTPIYLIYRLEDAKEYLYFKPGSYWIYENDSTKEIDSVFVTSCDTFTVTKHGTTEDTRHITLHQELIDMHLKSNRVDYWGRTHEYNLYTRSSSPDDLPNPVRAYIFTKQDYYTTGPGGNGIDDVFLHPYDKTWITGINSTINYENLSLNFNVGVNYFDSVRVFLVQEDGIFPQSKIGVFQGGKCWYYYAKNIGLVKLTNKGAKLVNNILITQSWNLIRYKIQK
jgi:hypothetical protein